MSCRLWPVGTAGGTTTIDGATYTYDNAGNRITKTNNLDSSNESYTYDAIYQLQQVTRNSTVTENYTYDPVGNRLSSLGVSPYSYNSSNELTSTSTTTFTYDQNGNTLSKTDSGGTTQYGWDYENRLTSVTLPNGGGVVSFTYDPFGRRIEKAGPSGTVIYAYDGANGIEELDASGNVTARYIQGAGIDESLAQSATGLNFYEADGLGSTTSLTDSTGTASEIYTYDAYGNLTGSAGQVANAYRYTGREFDQDTGLYYYRARYYDASVGRFLSEDPVGFGGGADFYSYVENDPTNLVDPLGRLPKSKDRWYGYDDSEFHKWFHRCWKQAGDPDATKAEIKEAYDEWVRRGKPKDGKCGDQESKCEEQAQEQPEQQPETDPVDDFFRDLNRRMHYPFAGPFWDKVRDWQKAIERGPRNLPTPLPAPVPVPPVPMLPVLP